MGNFSVSSPLDDIVFIPLAGEADKASPDGKTETSTSESSYDSLVEQVSVTNHLLVGIILFIGIFFGAFCMSHLFNRIRRQ